MGLDTFSVDALVAEDIATNPLLLTAHDRLAATEPFRSARVGLDCCSITQMTTNAAAKAQGRNHCKM